MDKILIIEDDTVIRNEIADKLSKWDYEAHICTDFKNVLDTFKKIGPKLVLMDISLPFYNGFYWCSKIRESSSVPIIFISSASDSLNIITAINYGADDFLEKPFDLNVLIAKVQAILRRAYNMSVKTSQITYDDYCLDLSKLSFFSSATSVELSKNEVKILKFLISNRGKIISRNELMNELWDNDVFIDDNTLSVNITRLRKKLDANGIKNLIHTKKGIGYYVL